MLSSLKNTKLKNITKCKIPDLLLVNFFLVFIVFVAFANLNQPLNKPRTNLSLSRASQVNEGLAAAIDCYNEIDPVYYDTDPNSEIHINSPANVSMVRNQVINYIWKGSGLPSLQPNSVTQNVSIAPYLDAASLANLARIDRIDILMDGGFSSSVYLLLPSASNNRLIIFHQGHGLNLYEFGGQETITFFLARGFTVLAFHMPLYGPNTGSVLDHDDMSGLESETVNPLKYFLEPIAVSLNYIDAEYDFSDISMTGVSGGGWTATLYPAIDQRISKSFPVAGSLPLYLREPPCGIPDVGDYEQGKATSPMVAHLYQNIASYLDLYILASYGAGHKQVQILNQFDTCCFAGIRYQTYENAVKAKMTALGAGVFEVALDVTHREHKISDWALSVMESQLGGVPPPPPPGPPPPGPPPPPPSVTCPSGSNYDSGTYGTSCTLGTCWTTSCRTDFADSSIHGFPGWWGQCPIEDPVQLPGSICGASAPYGQSSYYNQSSYYSQSSYQTPSPTPKKKGGR